MTKEATAHRNLLVLDLDETLIYACEKPLERAPDFSVYQYFIYCRPYLDMFLTECTKHFDLAVWSSASDPYVEAIVKRIVPDSIKLKFVWGRSRASLRRVITDDTGLTDPLSHLNYRKPLAKLKRYGWKLENILILDDTPSKSAQNFGNAIYPQPFEGDPADRDLKLLASYLPTLANCENVRAVEKRNWRTKALNVDLR